MLRNPVYTGKIIWNRRDFATGRQNGGGARMRARDEWVVSEEAHLPIVSESIFETAQERFAQKIRGKGRARRRRSPSTPAGGRSRPGRTASFAWS